MAETNEGLFPALELAPPPSHPPLARLLLLESSTLCSSEAAQCHFISASAAVTQSYHQTVLLLAKSDFTFYLT